MCLMAAKERNSMGKKDERRNRYSDDNADRPATPKKKRKNAANPYQGKKHESLTEEERERKRYVDRLWPDR